MINPYEPPESEDWPGCVEPPDDGDDDDVDGTVATVWIILAVPVIVVVLWLLDV